MSTERDEASPATRAVARAVLVVLWGVAAVAFLAVLLEGGLRVAAAVRARGAARYPAWAALEEAYIPFRVQHLHPLYFYFFPLEPAERVALSSPVCTLTREGFRGPAPSMRGSRRLAFLIGGSVAFGDGAESDAETITGHLNRLQSDYFFVNAGVPSWSSAQELMRVSFQLLDYAPALVVALDGANDVSESGIVSPADVDGAIGLPDHFPVLAEVAAGRRWPSWRPSGPWSIWPMVVPRTLDWLGLEVPGARRAEVPEGDVHAVTVAAQRYLTNLTRMDALIRASGGRFVAALQPMAPLHAHLSHPEALERQPAFARFQRAVSDSAKGFEWHDLSRMFDDELAVVPLRTGDLEPDTVFLDEVHMRGLGNARVARRIAAWVSRREGEGAP